MNKKLKKELESFTLFEKCLAWLVAVILLVVMAAVSYGAIYVITYLICWSFGLTFYPRMVIGVLAIAILINIFISK